MWYDPMRLRKLSEYCAKIWNNGRGPVIRNILTFFLLVLLSLQILAAISVSTGCVSYGICMAYTSSAIPSMLAPNNSLTIEIGTYETTWMSKHISEIILVYPS